MTTKLNVAKLLIEHGARVTQEEVLRFEDMKTTLKKHDFITLKLVLIQLMSTTWNPDDRDSDGYTALHLACKADNSSVVEILLSIGHCDPNVKSNDEEMPIQLTSDLKVMKILVEHNAKMTADAIFNVIKHVTESGAVELFSLSLKKGTMLWHPTDLNRDGKTALDIAYILKKPTIVNYLLSVTIKYDPSVLNSLLKLTTKLNVAKLLIKHGARVTPELVPRFVAKEATPNKHSLIKLMLTTWNPNDRDCDGYTALHHACKADRPTTVNLLLSVAHCDPNIKGSISGYTALHLACKAGNYTIVKLLLSVAHCNPNSKSNSDEVPLQMTTNPEIIKYGAKTSVMYKSYKKALGTSKPLQPPVKVFIVGNPSVGKSTLTAALKTEIGIIARYFSTRKVSGVDEKTVGIVPHDLEGGHFGRVTLYDFAGHREFYSGHAALLQTAIHSTPPIFIIVINLCNDKDEIIKSILYWISFLENQCASVDCKPHITLVGSHVDALKGVNPKDKIKMLTDSLDINRFINMEYVGFVAMNCQYHESPGMNVLRHLLIKSCEQLRIQEPITFNAHCFLVYLIDTFIDLPAVTIKTVSEKIENQQTEEGGTVLEFLPKSIEALYKICLELNDRGHILLLKDRIAAENSYVVIDKTFLLSKVSGTVFAPEDFKQYKQLSTNTGVVPLSKIIESFPAIKDYDILIGFLTHLEFCHELSDEAVHQLISEQYILSCF